MELFQYVMALSEAAMQNWNADFIDLDILGSLADDEPVAPKCPYAPF